MADEYKISAENYANWFALFHLCQNMGSKKAVHTSTVEFGKILNLSQQQKNANLYLYLMQYLM